MGPGDHPFARFGHNAILLEWAAAPGQEQGRAVVYNFGTFAFAGLDGVRDFMAGNFRYWLSATTLDRTLNAYSRDRRSLVAQELGLSPTERARLALSLAENLRPEHRYYDYDYYRDNCSTRVRDALDQLLGGQLERSLRGPGRLSFRAHTLRLTAGTLWLYGGLDLALGAATDRPTSRWDELFLPSELHDVLASASREQDGKLSKLVRSERVLLSAARPMPSATPPERRVGFAATGAALGAALAVLGELARRSRAARVGFGALLSTVGLLLGSLGCIFAGFWAYSRHWSAHQNLNLLLCPPWALALLVFGLGLALGREKLARRARQVVSLCFGSCVVALLLGLLPLGRQDNLRMVALLLPVWGGLWVGVHRMLAGLRSTTYTTPTAIARSQ